MTPGGTSGVPTAPSSRASSPRHSSHRVVVEHHAVPQVAGAAEVVVDGVELDAGGAHDLQRLGDDLGADAVAADDAHAVGSGGLRAGLVTHGRSVS